MLFSQRQISNIRRDTKADDTLNVVFRHKTAYRILKGLVLDILLRRVQFEIESQIFRVTLNEEDLPKFKHVLGFT